MSKFIFYPLFFIATTIFMSKAENQLAIDSSFYELKLGEATVTLCRYSTGDEQTVYFNMHENETTSVEAAWETLHEYGGTMFVLKQSGTRELTFSLQIKEYQQGKAKWSYASSKKDDKQSDESESELPLKQKRFSIDPNRIFSKEGIKKTLADYGQTDFHAEMQVYQFAQALIKKVITDKTKLLVTLHNNTEAYSALDYQAGGEYHDDIDTISLNETLDPSDFFFVTKERFFDILSAKKQNVVFQDNKNVTDDGSLSVYCGKKEIPYINVEAAHGNLEAQKQMLRVMRDAIP